MDGIEFVSKFREFPGTKDIPIIAMTGVIDQYSPSEIQSMGAKEVLLKPFNLKHFMTAVKSSLP